MKSELVLTIVYNNNKSIRCVYIDDLRIYGGKVYVSEGLRHDFLKIKTSDISEIARRNATHTDKSAELVKRMRGIKIEHYQNRNIDDMPFISPETLKAILDEFDKEVGK